MAAAGCFVLVVIPQPDIKNVYVYSNYYLLRSSLLNLNVRWHGAMKFLSIPTESLSYVDIRQ